MPRPDAVASSWRRVFLGWLPLRILRAHPRLFIAAAAGVLAGVILPESLRLTTRLLISWFVRNHDCPRNTADAAAQGCGKRRRTIVHPPPHLPCAIASIGAIVAQLATVEDLTGIVRGLHIGLAAMTIVTAWVFIHLTFAFHYAHEYFDELPDEPGRSRTGRGGLIFPGTDEPDYYDFLYFSYVIGVACQTADIAISSAPMRRTAAIHGVLAFFFNSAVLALTINIAAGLI